MTGVIEVDAYFAHALVESRLDEAVYYGLLKDGGHWAFEESYARYREARTVASLCDHRVIDGWPSHDEWMAMLVEAAS